MHCYTDKNGLEWTITIDLSCVRRIKDKTGINILESGSFEQYNSDYMKYAEMIWAAMMIDAFQKGRTEDQFYDGLSGDFLATAIEAYVQELFDFFPQKEEREMMRAIYRKSSENTRKALENGTAEVNNIVIGAPPVNAVESKPKKSTSSKSAIASADSSESTPEPTP